MVQIFLFLTKPQCSDLFHLSISFVLYLVLCLLFPSEGIHAAIPILIVGAQSKDDTRHRLEMSKKEEMKTQKATQKVRYAAEKKTIKHPLIEELGRVVPAQAEQK